MRFKELDALRGIAAVMVVFFHYTMNKDAAALGFKVGTTGVDLFFIISGFVILLSFAKINSSKEFIINRISRLYPAYWTCVTIVFAVLFLYGLYKPGVRDTNIIEYLGNMTMFQFYLNIPDLDGPYWTLIIEMTFYIFMLILFQFKLLKYIISICSIITILVFVSLRCYHHLPWVENIFYWLQLLQFFPLFFSGMLFYKIIKKESNDLYCYILILVCLLCQILLFNYSGRSRGYITIEEYSIMMVLYFSLFTLFVNGKLKFIVNNVSLFLGKISYALYLIHHTISTAFIIPTLVNKLHVNFWLALIAAFSISVTLATLITFFIEIPYGKKMREKLYSIN